MLPASRHGFGSIRNPDLTDAEKTALAVTVDTVTHGSSSILATWTSNRLKLVQLLPWQAKVARC